MVGTQSFQFDHFIFLSQLLDRIDFIRSTFLIPVITRRLSRAGTFLVFFFSLSQFKLSKTIYSNMVTLPDLNSLPYFQWIDETGRTRPLHADVREITDYVIDSNDWPSKEATVNSVLTKTAFDVKCEVVSLYSLSSENYC